MAHPFRVEVVSADRKVYSGEAESVVVPGVSGYFGILSGHAPLVSMLAIGTVEITPPNGPSDYLAVSGGFVEVMPDQVILLAETAETAKDIDIERARLAVERAEGRLRGGPHEGVDFDRARASLMRALNRLRTAERHI